MDDAMRSSLPMFSVSKNSKAYISGIQEGDLVRSINGKSSSGLRSDEATNLLRSADDRLIVELKRRNEKSQHTSEEVNIHNHLKHTNSNTEFGSSDSFSSRSSLTGGVCCPSDGELSTSTSDSQGSIIQVINGRKHVLKTPSPCPSPVQIDCKRTNSAPLIWSPVGTSRMSSGKSYKQVTFNIPTTSADEEIGGERGRRRGKKEGGEEGGGEQRGGRELRDHTQPCCPSSHSSPGFNEHPSAVNAQPSRPADAFSLLRNSAPGSGQGLTSTPNGNQSGVSSSGKIAATTPTWSSTSSLPSGSVQRGGSSRDSSQDRDLALDFRSSFENRTPFDGTSGVSEFRPSRSWSPAAPQRSDRYGIGGTQDVVKSSSFSYTPYESRRGRGVSDDQSKLMVEVNTEAKLIGSVPGEPNESVKSINQNEVPLPDNSSSLPRPRSALSTFRDRGPSPAWGVGTKSVAVSSESPRQVETGGENRGERRPTSPTNDIAGYRRTSLPLDDSSGRSRTPLVLTPSILTPRMEQSECEQNRMRYESFSPGIVVEEAKRASLPSRDTSYNLPSSLIVKSSSVASRPGSANSENYRRSNGYSHMKTESQGSIDLLKHTTPQSISRNDSSNNKPLVCLLNNSTKPATPNPDSPGFKTVTSVNFESHKSPSRIEPTGYKSVTSITFNSSKSPADPRRYRSLSPMPVDAVKARLKDEAVGCVVPSTKIQSITEQPTNTYGSVTNAYSEPLTHGSDSAGGGTSSSEVYGAVEASRNWPSPFNKDSSLDGSRGDFINDISSMAYETRLNNVVPESHKDFTCTEALPNKSENLIDFETCCGSSNLPSSGHQLTRRSNIGLNNPEFNEHSSKSSPGPDMLQCPKIPGESRESSSVFDSRLIDNTAGGEPVAGCNSNAMNSQMQFDAWTRRNTFHTEPTAGSWVNGASEIGLSKPSVKSQNQFYALSTQNTSHAESPANSLANGHKGLTRLDNESSNQFSSTESVSKQPYPMFSFINQFEQSEKPIPRGLSNPLQIVSSDTELAVDPRTDPMDSERFTNTSLPSEYSNLESTSHRPADALQSNKSLSSCTLPSNNLVTSLPNQSVICLSESKTDPLPDYFSNFRNQEVATPFSSAEVETCQTGCLQNPIANHVSTDCWSRNPASAQFPCNRADAYGTVRATLSKPTVNSDFQGSNSTAEPGFPVPWKSTITNNLAGYGTVFVSPIAQDPITGNDPKELAVEKYPDTVSATSAHHIQLETKPAVDEGPAAMNEERSASLKGRREENSTSSCNNSATSPVNGVSCRNWEPSCRPFSPYTLASFTKTSGYKPVKFVPSANGISTTAKSFRSASLSSDIPCRVLETSSVHTSNIQAAPSTSSTDVDPYHTVRPLADVNSRYSSVPPDSYRVFNAPDPSLPVIDVTPPRPQSPLGPPALDECNLAGAKSPDISRHTIQRQPRKHRDIKLPSAATNSVSEVQLESRAKPLEDDVIADGILKDSSCSATSHATNHYRGERNPLNLGIDVVRPTRLRCISGNGKATGTLEKQITGGGNEDRNGFAPKSSVSSGVTNSVENKSSILYSSPKGIVDESWSVETNIFQKKPEFPSRQMWSYDNISTQKENAAGREYKADMKESSPSTTSINHSEKNLTYDEPSQNGNSHQKPDDLNLRMNDSRFNLQRKHADERIETIAPGVKCNGNWSSSEQLSKEHSADYSRRRAESERRALEASRRPVLFREEKIPKPFIKYKGVGPKDQETGVPIALRNCLDGRRSQREWYKEMYSLLHKKHDERTRPSPAGNKNEYREQQDSPSLHVESDTEADYGRIRQMERPVSPAQSDSVADYRRYRQFGAWTYNGNGKEKSEKFDWSSASTSSLDSSEGSTRNSSRGEEYRRNISKEDQIIDVNANSTEYTEQAMASDRSSSISSYDEEIERAMRENSLQRPEAKPLTRRGRGKARALYTFRTQADKELSFRKGDVISLRKQIDKNWYEGQLSDGRKGLIPANYVEVLTSIKDAETSAGEREGEAIAKYTFRGNSGLELSFRKGDVVRLIRRIDSGWYEGRLGRCQGILPVTYVDVIREPKTPVNTPTSSLATTPRTGSPFGSTSALSDGRPSLPSAPLSPLSASPQPTSPVPATPLSLDLTQFDFDINPPAAFADPSDCTITKGKSAIQNGNQHPTSASASHGSLTSSRCSETDSNPRPSDRPGSAGACLTGSGRRSGTGTGSADYSSDLDRSDDDITMYNKLTAQMLEAMQRTTPGGAALKTTSGPCPDDIRDLLNGLGRSTDDTNVQYPAYRALYDYKTQNDDELELKEGDVIYVMEKCDDGWFVGTSQRTDDFGTFPGNYVEKIE